MAALAGCLLCVRLHVVLVPAHGNYVVRPVGLLVCYTQQTWAALLNATASRNRSCLLLVPKASCKAGAAGLAATGCPCSSPAQALPITVCVHPVALPCLPPSLPPSLLRVIQPWLTACFPCPPPFPWCAGQHPCLSAPQCPPSQPPAAGAGHVAHQAVPAWTRTCC